MLKIKSSRKFPSGLMVKILCFNCQGPRFNAWSGD